MKDFERFKKKVLREHIFKSLFVGLGVGLLGAALAIVVAFLTNPAIAVVVSIVTGLTLGGAGGYWYWYKCKPSDKKIALRLDKKLGLNEKISTMIEFQGKEGVILNKQREDAEERLAEKPTKALPFALSVWAIPALVISAAFFTASFFTPQNQNRLYDSTSSSSGADLDSLTSSLVDEAKSSLDENSNIAESIKSAMESILDSLQSELQGVSDISERSEIVESAKSEIDDLTRTYAKQIGQALSTEDDIFVKSMGTALIHDDIQAERDALQGLFNYLMTLGGQDLVDYANDVADQIDDALDKAINAGVPEDDSLLLQYRALAEALRNITNQQPSQSQGSDAQQSGDPQQSGQQSGQSGQQQSGGQSGQQQSGQQSGESGQQQPGQSGQPTSEQANSMASAIQSAANQIESAMNQNSAIQSAGSEIKSQMDSMVNPAESGSGSGSGESTTEGSGSGGSQTEGSGSGGSLTSGSGSGEGSQTEGSGSGEGSATEGSGSGEGSQTDGSGSGSGQGSGSGSGSGDGAGQGGGGSDVHTETIYTGSGQTEYGSVINSYQGGFVDDHQGNAGDDPEAGDAAEDYFNGLYGSGQGGGK